MLLLSSYMEKDDLSASLKKYFLSHEEETINKSTILTD